MSKVASGCSRGLLVLLNVALLVGLLYDISSLISCEVQTVTGEHFRYKISYKLALILL